MKWRPAQLERIGLAHRNAALQWPWSKANGSRIVEPLDSPKSSPKSIPLAVDPQKCPSNAFGLGKL